MIEQDLYAMSGHVHDLKILIAPFYLLIAVAIYWAGRGADNPKQKVAVYALTAIFALCDVAGYAGPSLGFPSWMIVASHALLPIACGVFLFTNQHSKLFGK